MLSKKRKRLAQGFRINTTAQLEKRGFALMKVLRLEAILLTLLPWLAAGKNGSRNLEDLPKALH